jgi:uncharacterized protein YjbJ (UPF0337 family)
LVGVPLRRREVLAQFLGFLLQGTPKGDDMKSSTKDQVEGKLHEIKGKVKEAAGQVTKNPDLTNEGQAEELAGKVQKKVGQVKKVFEK